MTSKPPAVRQPLSFLQVFAAVLLALVVAPWVNFAAASFVSGFQRGVERSTAPTNPKREAFLQSIQDALEEDRAGQK